MAVTESQVVGTELEKVISKVETVFERDPGFAGQVKKKNVEVVSYRQMRVPLEMNPGGNFLYFNPDGGPLGRGSGPDWDKAVVQSVFMSLGIEYTKLAQWATDDSRKAIQDAVRKLTATATLELIRQLNSQIQTDGSGAIGTIGTVTTVAGVSDTYVCNTDGYGVRLMRDKQVIQVFDSTLVTLRGSAQITQWDVEGQSVTVEPPIAGSIAGDIIVTSGISTPTALPGLYGVPYHDSNSSSGTWLGFSRSTTPQIRASGVNGGNAALALPQPRLAINKIGNRVGENNTYKPQAWMHPCQQQAYEQLGQLIQAIFKEPVDSKLNLYYGNGMQMAGAPVKTDFNWNMKRIDFLDTAVWGWGETLPIGFYKVDGRQIFEIRSADGGLSAADIFYMVVGRQSFVNNPAAISYIYDLQVPPGYQVS